MYLYVTVKKLINDSDELIFFLISGLSNNYNSLYQCIEYKNMFLNFFLTVF